MSRSHMRSRAAACLAAAASLVLSSCDTLLEAEAPSRILEESLIHPSNASVLLAGAIADFECAFAAYIVTMGTVTDELADAQAAAAIWDLDRRTNNPASGQYAAGSCGQGFTGLGPVYIPVSTARYAADKTLDLLEGWSDDQVPNRTALIARASAYSGYAHVLLGEGFCSAAVDLGPEMTPAEVFQRAEAKFTRAIEAATTAQLDSVRFMALIGRARARVDQGRLTEAAADAAQVPNGFQFVARYTSASGRSENRLFRNNNTTGQVTVDPSYRGLTFQGVADTRVPVANANRLGSNASTPLWSQSKYASLNASIPIASWREALLIRAEAAGGQTAVGFINQLHARVNLPDFQSTDAAAIRAQIIEERKRELFLESHRLFDTIRFQIPLTPPAGSAFPFGGGTYGNDKCLPLPDVERLNNPSIPKN
jgi:starch-binding outer membrane protein, SusD/RagB family